MTEHRTGPSNSEREGAPAAVSCVDVIIAARNRADTIERAVRSALEQAEVRTVIVVDDASDDDTAAKAKSCDPGGKRVIVERLSANVGPSAARNIAIKISKVPWLAILDGDDYFLPGRLATLLSVADAWDFVADDIIQVREDQVGKTEFEPVLFADHHQPFALDLEAFVLGNIRQHGVLRTELGFLKPLVRRSFIDAHGLKYDEKLRLGEDYALYARALAVGARFLIVPKPGYASVVRADSLSACHTRHDLECLRDSNAALIRSATLTAAEQLALRGHYTSVDCRVQWLAIIEGYKARSVNGLLAPFCRSPRISLYLLERVVTELVARSKRTRTKGL
jgi:succinoglycan biosynthesis protein ExoU